MINFENLYFMIRIINSFNDIFKNLFGLLCYFFKNVQVY
jgi:hypothetical protein